MVNLQGDEPLIPVSALRQVAQNLGDHADADAATLCEPLHSADLLFDPHVVKVVTDRRDFALYFTRAAVPWDREAFVDNPPALPDNPAALPPHRTICLPRGVSARICPVVAL